MSEENQGNGAIQFIHYTELSTELLEEMAGVVRAAFSEYMADGIFIQAATLTGDLLRERMERDNQTAVIYTREGRIMGVYRGTLMSDATGKWLYATGMAVLPECRKQGIGVKLVQGLEEWARQQGAIYASLCTSDRAPKPKAFHHKCGYKDWYYSHHAERSYIQIYMRKDFGEPYPAAKRLARLYSSWLLTRAIFTRKGELRLWYRLKTKLLGRGILARIRKG